MMQKICLRLFFLCAILCINGQIYADEISDNFGQTEGIVASAKSKDVIGNVLLQAMSLMGISYRWGGTSPETGMDCSGFIRYVFKKSLGITLPRTANEMSKVGRRVNLDKMEPGDLIFFNTRRGSNTHLGMYIGNNKFIQSPRTGAKIQITELEGYWRSHINGVKRIVHESLDESGNTTVEEYQDVRTETLPVRSCKPSPYYSKRSTKSAHKKSLRGSKSKLTSTSRKVSTQKITKQHGKKPSSKKSKRNHGA